MEKESIYVKFLATDYFLTKKGSASIKDNYRTNVWEIRAQKANTLAAIAAQASIDQAGSSMKASGGSMMIVQMLLSGSMQQMLGMINAL